MDWLNAAIYFLIGCFLVFIYLNQSHISYILYLHPKEKYLTFFIDYFLLEPDSS